MIDDERIIREALQAGPTPGPWAHDGQGGWLILGPEHWQAAARAYKRETADYIAACSPDRIERVLAGLERLRAELAEAKRDAERAATRLELTKRETTMLRNQRDELRLVLDKRPAMNAGLLEAYAAWSASVYALDWLDAGDDAMRKEGGE